MCTLVSQFAILHDSGTTLQWPSSCFQLCVGWCRRCGSPLECFTRTAWCRSDSPCMLAGSVQHFVFLAARWWFVAQGATAQVQILKTTTTTQNTAELPTPALLLTAMPRAHMCESEDTLDRNLKIWTHTNQICEEFVFYCHGLTANMWRFGGDRKFSGSCSLKLADVWTLKALFEQTLKRIQRETVLDSLGMFFMDVCESKYLHSIHFAPIFFQWLYFNFFFLTCVKVVHISLLVNASISESMYTQTDRQTDRKPVVKWPDVICTVFLISSQLPAYNLLGNQHLKFEKNICKRITGHFSGLIWLVIDLLWWCGGLKT